MVIVKGTLLGNQISDRSNCRVPFIAIGITGISFFIAVKKAPSLNFPNPSSAKKVPSGKKIIESQQIANSIFQGKIGPCTCIALVTKHHGRPLPVAHGPCAAVGEQIDKNLPAFQSKKVVFRISDPFFALMTSAPAD